MKLDALRTPNTTDGDAIMPSQNTNGTWAVWDEEWEVELEQFPGGESGFRQAKAGAIQAMIERYGEYDGYDGWDYSDPRGIQDDIERDDNGIPV